MELLDKPVNCDSGAAEIVPASYIPPNGMVNKKRKHEDDTASLKRLKWETNTSSQEDLNLVMLPDDVLIIILKKLDQPTLLNLKSTCSLFDRLCEDYTLWRKVDYTSCSATVEIAECIRKLVHNETKVIAVKGRFTSSTYDPNSVPEDIISREWMHCIGDKCPNLETLALPKHFINCSAITLTDYPKTLTCLDLSSTNLRFLPFGRSYFREVSILIPNLKTLILSDCDWFEPHSLMAISKCKHLEELRLNDCKQVRDCLAYCGLSTRGGFCALKTIDLRKCLITTSELVCFSSVSTLTNLYLENVSDLPVIIDPAISVICTRNEHIHLGNDNVIKPDLQRLIVRNYILLEDHTLLKLARHALSLKFLDVTGCGVTREGVESFINLRPNVELVHSVLPK